MDNYQKAVVLLVLTVSSVSAAHSIELNVDVSGTPEYAAYGLEHLEETENVQQVNVSLENPGVVGCRYRLRARYNTSEVQEAWSRSHAIWPGGTDYFSMEFLALNHTGKVPVNLYVRFCDQQEKIGNFSYNVTEKSVINSTVEVKTVEADSSGARVRTEVERAKMVPVETPKQWKVSSANITAGEARLEYEAPLYRPENITYAVVSNGQIIGQTRVSLQESSSLLDLIQENMFKLLLAFSVLLNILLLGVLLKFFEVESLKL